MTHDGRADQIRFRTFIIDKAKNKRAFWLGHEQPCEKTYPAPNNPRVVGFADDVDVFPEPVGEDP